jgi:hypothetical protein
MPITRKTPVGPILTAIQAQIVLNTGLPPERVALLGRHQGPPAFQGDQDVWVQPGNLIPDPPQDQGSGRVAPVMRRIIVVAARTRLALDMSDRDDSLLTDLSLGHMYLEEAIANSLQHFLPRALDATGDNLLWEPMRLVPYQEPTDPEAPQGPQWEETRLAFEIAYVLYLNTGALLL